MRHVTLKPLRRAVAPALLLVLALPGCGGARPATGAAPLVLERTILLPAAKGRIDHLAIDLADRRLFVAEVAQGSVEAVDLDRGVVAGRITGLRGPQGLAWLPRRRELVVASDGGSVTMYNAALQEVARIPLGSDADDVRVDPRNGHVVVGYGRGGLAVIDPDRRTVAARVPLPRHPEGFVLAGDRAYVNLPEDAAVFAADIDQPRVLARWPTGVHRLNFPMAAAPDARSITIAYRFPAALAQIDTVTGKTMSLHPACGDADDLFLWGDRSVLICGAGEVELARADGTKTAIKTRKGARTGLLVPELNRLFVAAPADSRPAEIEVFALAGRP